MNNPALPGYVSQAQAQGQPQNPYAAAAFTQGHPQPAGFYAPSPGPPYDPAQTSFQPSMIPNHMQRPSHPQQIHQPAPQQFYQQPQQPSLTGFPHQATIPNAGSPFSGQTSSNRPSPVPIGPGSRHNSTPSIPQALPPSSSQNAIATSLPTTVDPNMAAALGMQGQPNASLAQQAQIQNAAQAARAAAAPHQQQPPSQQPQPQPGQAQGQPMSPQSAARERARVSVLLEINTHLLQEVVSLQAQGKAGSTTGQGQQSPTSPTSATDPTNALNNSPGEPPKSAGGNSKPASQEYADCMRRLQANLSYLAAIADAKKKVNGALPAGPAILAPPAHLTPVHDLYKKLNALFPAASQSAANKAVGYPVNPGQGQKQRQVAGVMAQG